MTILIALCAALATFLISSDAQKVIGSLISATWLTRIATLASALVFVLTVVIRQRQWAMNAGKHAVTLEHYTQFIRRLDIFLSDAERKPRDEIEETTRQFVEDYTRIGEYAPKTPPGRRFLKLKREHLQTVAISRELDTNPFISLRRAKRKVKLPSV